jgi:nucleoside-diphosphate-sugar epimerase
MKVLINGGCGYVGTVLYKYLKDIGLEVNSVDLEWFGNSSWLHNVKRDYNCDLGNNYDWVIHLAGHSSVQSCDLEPKASLHNNNINFFQYLSTLKTKLIYASSASVYGSSVGLCTEDMDLPDPVKPYDQQKQALDIFTQGMDNVFGLRFGTVCGFSPNPRNELLINSMVKSAYMHGRVNVAGPDFYRAVLDINDLCRAITKMIFTEDVPGGIYNLASFNSSIGQVGKEVSNILNVPLNVNETTDTLYSWRIDTSKFQKDYDFQFEGSIASIVKSAGKNDFNRVR